MQKIRCVCTTPCWIQVHEDERVPGQYALGQVIEGDQAALLLRDYARLFDELKEDNDAV